MKKKLMTVSYYLLVCASVILIFSEGKLWHNFVGMLLFVFCISYLVSLDSDGVCDLLGINWLSRFTGGKKIREDLFCE